ncbi:ATP-binding protein [Sulfitobacter sp. PS-8MA]|uniref:sensor histidine kinase n=1 Tax=Sulfitobacter sp. PS-8MA TaxID=3237707 RepID=UPI0034C6507B
MVSLPPYTQLLQALSSRITTRLRAALSVVAIIFCAAGLSTALQMQTVLNTPAHLNKSALPMLTIAQQIERDLNSVFLTMDMLQQRETPFALSELEADVSAKISTISARLSSLRTLGMSPSLVDRVEHRLLTAKRASKEVLRSREALRKADEQIAATLDQIRDLQERSNLILDGLSYRFSAETDRLLRAAARKNITASPQDNSFSKLMLDAINLNDLRLDIDALVNIAVSEGLQKQPDHSDRARLLVSEKLQDVIARLPRIADEGKRRALASQTAMMRERLLNESDGFFSHLAARQHFQAKFNVLRAEHLPMIVEISNMTSDLTAYTLRLVDTITQRLRDTIHRVIWIVAVTALTALLIIILTNRLVIERQFNSRIKKLTGAVSAISAGDLDHPIPVKGRDELGEMARALVVFRRNAEELRRSNVELEKFAYVAAHDLRSPLRAVHELSVWVVEDEDNRLSAESHAYLCMLQQRIGRLNRLLKDLLDYARAGQNEPAAEPVDLHHLVRELARGADPEGRFEVTFEGPEEPVTARLTPLQQILGNLLSNAIKHHDSNHGAIQVRAEIDHDRLLLRVTDDGPGIDPRYQSRVFELFQTLRPRDEVEGSGLGLAIVSKLASHYKGSVTLISDPKSARGATFVVELPLPHAPSAPPIPRVAAAA